MKTRPLLKILPVALPETPPRPCNHPVIAQKKGNFQHIWGQESWLSSILNWFLSCKHSRKSRVWTLNGRVYQTCIDCGKEIPYDWEEMRPM